MDGVGPAAGGAANEAGIGFAADRQPNITPSRPPQPRRRMAMYEWRPLRENTSRGVIVTKLLSGLFICDHAGRLQHAALLGWRNRELADAFSQAAVEMVREHDPDLGAAL